MRKWIALLIVLQMAGGCTSMQLGYNTVRQASTVTNMQHQLVMNNLAAFTCNADAIPSQAKLMNGATQVVDTGSGTAEVLPRFLATLGLSRTAVDQWITSPVTDELTLRLLRIAYRRALGFDEDLYTDDLANRVAHRLKMQLPSLSDMALENAHMYSRGPALPQLLDRPGWNGDSTPGFTSDDPAVQLWKKDTGDIISSNSERIVQRGERLTSETLTVTPVLFNGVPEAQADENSARVLVATPYATEIRRQILALNEYLIEIHPGWFCAGKPSCSQCACYVGHHKDCNLHGYVWVDAENRREFEEFTLKIMRLSTFLADPNGGQFVGGVIYSPPVSR